MSTMTLGVTSRSRRTHWSHLKVQLVEWLRRARSRAELQSLNDQSLQDIGISRCTAEHEASKPFWMS